jgi:hypothetical protein
VAGRNGRKNTLIVHVQARTHRAIRVVQHLGRIRAENEGPDRPEPVRRHQDHVGVLVLGVLDDLPRRIALDHDAPRWHPIQSSSRENAEQPLRFRGISLIGLFADFGRRGRQDV